MKKILQYIFVIQEISNKNRKPKIGKGYSSAYRLNPYNPLSYLVVIIAFLIGIILFGFVGIWNQVDGSPFKWN